VLFVLFVWFVIKFCICECMFCMMSVGMFVLGLLVSGVGVMSCCCGPCFCVSMGWIDDVGYCVYVVTWVGCVVVVFVLTCVGVEWCGKGFEFA
jgi:hypothetical protein